MPPARRLGTIAYGARRSLLREDRGQLPRPKRRGASPSLPHSPRQQRRRFLPAASPESFRSTPSPDRERNSGSVAKASGRSSRRQTGVVGHRRPRTAFGVSDDALARPQRMALI